MSYHQPNKAPPSCYCPRCVHLVERQNSEGVDLDRCAKGVPMHDPCAWHTTSEELRKLPFITPYIFAVLIVILSWLVQVYKL